MDSLTMLRKARDHGLTVYQRGQDTLVVQGPSSMEQMAQELLGYKPEILEVLRTEEIFECWMQRMWIEASRPTWRNILADSLKSGDQARAKFASHMISNVLGDDLNA
jgi:hypothetical protein